MFLIKIQHSVYWDNNYEVQEKTICEMTAVTKMGKETLEGDIGQEKRQFLLLPEYQSPIQSENRPLEGEEITVDDINFSHNFLHFHVIALQLKERTGGLFTPSWEIELWKSSSVV